MSVPIMHVPGRNIHHCIISNGPIEVPAELRNGGVGLRIKQPSLRDSPCMFGVMLTPNTTHPVLNSVRQAAKGRPAALASYEAWFIMVAPVGLS